MKKRTRLLIAISSIVIGVTTLGYWYYINVVMDAFIHMFEALGLDPEKTPDTLTWMLLPYLGGTLVLAGLTLILMPFVKSKLAKTHQ